MSRLLLDKIRHSKIKQSVASLAAGVMFLGTGFGMSNRVYGDGYFEPAQSYNVGGNPESVAIGDADNDGYNDIITANYSSNNVSLIRWNGTNFDSQLIMPVGSVPHAVAIGDADNDGDNDIVTANQVSNNVSLIRWSVSGFGPQTTISVSNLPHPVAIGDADNDGYNDIVTAGDSGVASLISWNSVTSNFDSYTTMTVGSNPRGIAIGDLENDTDNDIVTANYSNHSVSLIRWNGTNFDSHEIMPVSSYPHSVAIGDADNDGDNDIITANYGGDNVSLIRWSISGFGLAENLSVGVGTDPIFVAIGDANNDGYNDIATANSGSNNVSLLKWNPITSDFDQEIIQAGGSPNSVAIGDADNDGYNDLVTANYGENTISFIRWHQTSLPQDFFLNPNDNIQQELESRVGTLDFPLTFHLAPGVYNGNITMQEYESIVGEDRSGSVINGLVRAVDNVFLMDLTVRNPSLYEDGVCIDSTDVSPTIDSVTIDGNGNPSSIGILFANPGSDNAYAANTTLTRHRIGIMYNNSDAIWTNSAVNNNLYGAWFTNTTQEKINELAGENTGSGNVNLYVQLKE